MKYFWYTDTYEHFNTKPQQSRLFVVTFVYNCCEKSQQQNKKTFYEQGAYKVLDLNLDTLDAPNHIKKRIKSTERAGFWIFKPYALQQLMRDPELTSNDVVGYLDAGTHITKPVSHIIDYVNTSPNKFLLLRNGDTIATRTKMDAVYKVLDNADSYSCEQFGKMYNVSGGFQFYKNNKKNREFVEKWKHLLQDEHILNNEPSIKKNCSNFIEHRHDQSLLALLLRKEGYEIEGENFPQKKLITDVFGIHYHFKGREI
jgi:hypothetical protein